MEIEFMGSLAFWKKSFEKLESGSGEIKLTFNFTYHPVFSKFKKYFTGYTYFFNTKSVR